MDGGGGTPADAWYDATTGTNRGYGSPGGGRPSAETERILADTGNARFALALVLLVVIVLGGILLAIL